jgi:hypothetical protein
MCGAMTAGLSCPDERALELAADGSPPASLDAGDAAEGTRAIATGRSPLDYVRTRPGDVIAFLDEYELVNQLDTERIRESATETFSSNVLHREAGPGQAIGRGSHSDEKAELSSGRASCAPPGAQVFCVSLRSARPTAL